MNIYEQNYVIHTFLLIYQPKAKVLSLYLFYVNIQMNAKYMFIILQSFTYMTLLK
jgi:hypothetical protein